MLIVFSLLEPTIEFFRDGLLQEFFTTTRWAPLFKPAGFGVWPIVVGTLWVAFIAILVAVPLGLGAAFYLSEYARPRVRKIVKPILEMLAGVPTVVFGFFALTFINPELVARFWPVGATSNDFSALGAGVVTGIMIMPIVASLSEDAMSSVSRFAAGGCIGARAARSREVCTKVVFPAAISGIVAAIVLAVSRAIGETMIAVLASGCGPNLSDEPRPNRHADDGGLHRAAPAAEIVPTGSIEFKTIFAVGATPVRHHLPPQHDRASASSVASGRCTNERDDG